jgi:hypothetical protein
MAKIRGYRGGDVDDVADEMAEDIMSGSDREEYMQRAQEALYDDGYTAQHGEYTLPGGENYREVLLKVPGFKGEQKLMELEAMRRRVDPKYHSNRYEELTKQIDELKAQKAAMPEQFQGVDMHFKGEPGILASIRVSDRAGPKGEKVLHIEEIQSDWHQEGRKQGYGKVQRHEYEVVDPNGQLLITLRDKAEAEAYAKKRGATVVESAPFTVDTGVPDAPFKKNWHELALKRMLNYAAENGYDKIAITPGAAQADRYSLAKHISDVAYDPRHKHLTATGLKGEAINKMVEPEELPQYIGQELASKLLQSEPQQGRHKLSGLDIQTGGEGMKGFYDKMIPSYLNDYGKKYGVQVGEMDIITHPEKSKPQVAAPGIGYFPEPIIEPAKTAKVHSFDITPEMREEITGKGMPLYQQIGIPAGGAAAGAEALQQEEPGYAEGGPVMAAKGGEFDTEPDMSDGGLRIQGTAFKRGGKVKNRRQVTIADNPDTMWLELMSKS